MNGWYRYNQNNSGGTFDEDENLCQEIFIEAADAEEANAKAQTLGVYFDGCETERDCPCCGDRWYRAYAPETFPLKWDNDTSFASIEEYADFLTNGLAWRIQWTSVSVRLFYADGRVVAYTRTPEQEAA